MSTSCHVQETQARTLAGRVYTGLLTAERLEHIIARLPGGRSELMTQPGYVDEHLARVGTRLRVERERELELLCAPATRALLARECVELAAGKRTRAKDAA